jgi:hypothetical protein
MPTALETYSHQERARAIAWKQATTTLPIEAKIPAPYIDKDGRSQGKPVPYCFPAEHATLSLLPEVRDSALTLFGELGIPWHAGIGGGPSNHLLSSQVQCANALGQMVDDADRIVRAFGEPLGTSEVLHIEPDRCLTFEFIGPVDYFNEAPDKKRVRGAHCTSVDAAFLHRTVDDVVELVLVEWKYTESYRKRDIDPDKDATRWKRYGASLMATDSPVRGDLLEFSDLLDEPIYQLVRQQLLAHALEKEHTYGADRVRVVHVCPRGNVEYQQSIHRPTQRALGDSTSEVWGRLLRRHDRFVSMDSAVFLDPAITSEEYCSRYGVPIDSDDRVDDA